jgi:hypothetical protein
MVSPALLKNFSWVNESLPAFQIAIKSSDLRDYHYCFQEFK